MENTTNRFIAFIDILGFKNLVDSKSQVFIFEKLSSLVNLFDKIKQTSDGLKIWMFSDSILIISDDDSEKSADNILYYTSAIITKALEIELLAKGAIAFGEFTADYDKSIFFGKPLIHSYQLQDEMKMSSVVLHHTAENRLKNMKYEKVNLLANHRCFEYITPMKYGIVKHMHLNWLEYYNLHLAKTIKEKEEIFKKFELLIEKLYLDISGQPRQYLDNTIQFLQKCKNYNA